MKKRFYFKIFDWEVFIVKKEVVAPFIPPRSSKKKELKKIGLGWCDVIQKVQYPKELAKLKAEQITKSSRGFNKIRAYPCEFCNTWHLTHKKSYLKMINRR